MKRHPAADPNSNGRYFFSSDPHAGQTVSPRGHDIPFGQRCYQDVFKPTQVAMDIFAVVSQVQNGIAHQLPRPVKRHLPAATDTMDRYPTGVEQIFFITPTAQRKHRGMFEE